LAACWLSVIENRTSTYSKNTAKLSDIEGEMVMFVSEDYSIPCLGGDAK